MRISSFSKSYDGKKVLDFKGTEFEKGKIHCIIGANGSGKSTFAKILAGVLEADKKGCFLEEKLRVGYMPQKNFAFRMTTKANILLGGKDEKRADELMDAVGIRHLAKKRADKLSGGETARMALARLMMGNYDLLILDEPTAAMDMETTIAAETLIKMYVAETGCTMIVVTHSLQQARRIADEVMYFHRGMLLESGSREVVLYRPEREETQRFLEFYGV